MKSENIIKENLVILSIIRKRNMKFLVHWHVVLSHIVKYFLIYDIRRYIDIFTIFISDRYL